MLAMQIAVNYCDLNDFLLRFETSQYSELMNKKTIWIHTAYLLEFQRLDRISHMCLHILSVID